jgi:hypothetical protein
MKTNPNRSFDCKNEELPVVCRFGALSLARDLNDFTTYSSMFDAAYLAAFQSKIEAVQELVLPRSETVELKVLTDRIYLTLDGLVTLTNRLEGYLKLAGKQVPISSADFGLVQLRTSAHKRDVENVLQQLSVVDGNIRKYQSALKAKGLTDGLTGKLSETAKQLTADKERKYTLVSTRAAIVQSNTEELNDLKVQLTEICRIGKVLYKGSDQAKLKDYTFAHLMKQVRRETKVTETKPETVAVP